MITPPPPAMQFSLVVNCETQVHSSLSVTLLWLIFPGEGGVTDFYELSD